MVDILHNDKESTLPRFLEALVSYYDEVIEVNLHEGTYINLLHPPKPGTRPDNMYIDFMLMREQMVHPDDRQIFTDFFDEKYIDENWPKQGCIRNISFRHLRDGKYRWVSVHSIFAACSKEEDKESRVYFACFKVIDEEKQQEIENVNRLQYENKELADLNGRLLMLIERVSRGIRTPLNDIVGMAGLSMHSLDDTAKLKDYVNNINKAARKMSKLLSIIKESVDNGYIMADEEFKDATADEEEHVVFLENSLLEVSLFDTDHSDIKTDDIKTEQIQSVGNANENSKQGKSDDIIGTDTDSKKMSGSYEAGLEKAKSVLRGKRVLLVEDNELNRETTKLFLELYGTEVETAENGKNAVISFVSKPAGYYSLVLMDIKMPVLDGNSAARCIRISGKDDAESIPIFALSASSDEEDMKLAKEAGMNAYIMKPIEFEDLICAIAKVVGEA